MLVDITGDGRADVITTYQHFTNSHWPRKRYDMFQTDVGVGGAVTGFRPLPLGISFPDLWNPNLNPQEANNLQYDGQIVLADVNGDGLVDVGRQWFFGFGNSDLRIRSNQNGTLRPYDVVSGNALWGRFSVPGSSIFVGEHVAVDLDGDGRTEIVMQQTDGVHSFGVNGRDVNGSTVFEKIPTNFPFGPVPLEKVTLDFNGDGLRDILFGTASNIPSQNALWLNTGNGFLPVADPAGPRSEVCAGR